MSKMFQKLLAEGWEEDRDFRVTTFMRGTLTQLHVIKKVADYDDCRITRYRTIKKNGALSKERSITIQF